MPDEQHPPSADETREATETVVEPETTTEQQPSNWEVRPLVQVKDIKASEFHPEKKWMATKFQIEHPDSTLEEVESQRNILTIDARDGTRIEVPAFAVDHIMKLHLKGEEAGGQIAGGSLETSFGIVAEHLPEQLPFKNGAAAFEVNVGQPTGTEGVTSQKEMLEKGVVSSEDLATLKSGKDEVFRLNIEGTDTDKQTFVEQFNAQFAGRNVKLGIRGGAITPFFSTERQPTEKMFIVIGKEKDQDQTEHNRVWTMTPGRYMDKLPTDGKFSGRTPSEGVTEGETVASIWRKAKAGEPLTDAESSLVREQQTAQECWWNGGFIVPPEKPQPVPSLEAAPQTEKAETTTAA